MIILVLLSQRLIEKQFNTFREKNQNYEDHQFDWNIHHWIEIEKHVNEALDKEINL